MRCSLRVALVALVATVALLLPGPAAAWRYLISNNQPGQVYMPPVFPFEDGRFTTYGPFLMFLTFDAPYVYRSPATSGAQIVTGIYLINRWNGSQWVTMGRQNMPIATIAAGQRGVYLPKLYRSPGTNVALNRGYFKVQLLVAWAVPSGPGLGNVVLTPDRAGDLRCRQMLRPCHATADWVRLGRSFALGGGW